MQGWPAYKYKRGDLVVSPQKGKKMRKLNFWMGTKAVVEIFFGLGFVLVPIPLMAIFGVDLSSGGALVARLCGAVFIASSMILWQSRNESPTHPIIRAIVAATVVSNGIGFIATLLASINGVWNVFGWFPVVLNLVLLLVFSYFLFLKVN
jgi:hypothetical protein